MSASVARARAALDRHAAARRLQQPTAILLGVLHLSTVAMLLPSQVDGHASAASAAPAGAGWGIAALMTGLLLASLALAPRRRPLHTTTAGADPADDRPQGEPAVTPVARAAAAAATSPASGTARDWGDLMARVNHEFRTPLNAVLGFADVMSREMLGPLGHPSYREYARHIHDSGTRLLRAAEDTIAMTSLVTRDGEGCAREPLSLSGLLADAWSHTQPAGSPATALDLAPIATMVILGDRAVLRQALINILTAVAIRRRDEAQPIAVRAEAASGLVRLSFVLEKGIAAASPSSAWVACPAPGADLHIGLARRLLQLQGIDLCETCDGADGWSVRIVLDQPVQPDFFAARAADAIAA